jgi:hypothetical protein
MPKDISSRVTIRAGAAMATLEPCFKNGITINVFFCHKTNKTVKTSFLGWESTPTGCFPATHGCAVATHIFFKFCIVLQVL